MKLKEKMKIVDLVKSWTKFKGSCFVQTRPMFTPSNSGMTNLMFLNTWKYEIDDVK